MLDRVQASKPHGGLTTAQARAEYDLCRKFVPLWHILYWELVNAKGFPLRRVERLNPNYVEPTRWGAPRPPGSPRICLLKGPSSYDAGSWSNLGPPGASGEDVAELVMCREWLPAGGRVGLHGHAGQVGREEKRVSDYLASFQISTVSELRELFAARRRQLGWSQLELDDRAGLQDQYAGKLEIGTRNFGDMSLSCVLGALGLELSIRERRDGWWRRVFSTNKRGALWRTLRRALWVLGFDLVVGLKERQLALPKPSGEPSP